MKRNLSFLLALLLCLLPACGAVQQPETTEPSTSAALATEIETTTESETTTEPETTEADITTAGTATTAAAKPAAPPQPGAAAKTRPKTPNKPLGIYEELEQVILPMKLAFDEEQRLQREEQERIAKEREAERQRIDRQNQLRRLFGLEAYLYEPEVYAMMVATGGDGYGGGGYGATNIQVAGVDEADILKNDGQYLYYASGDKVYIIQPLPADKMKVVSTISLKDHWNIELYVLGDRLAVVSGGYEGGYYSGVTVRIYDISDRAKPALLSTFSQEGNLISSRMQEGRVYLFTNTYKYLGHFELDGGAIAPEDILPRLSWGGKAKFLPAEKIAVLPDVGGPSYLIASSIDIRGAKAEPETIAVLGGGRQLYMSQDAVYITNTKYDQAWWRSVSARTEIFRFDLYAEGKIAPGPRGEVAGTPLNQFSMDEHKGYFRIATTGSNAAGEAVNIVTILDKDLKEAGCINNIAPGETIQSARFMGDIGYLVTFRRTDPLFAIDLSNPAKLKILGELKIPGFSSYLHPWDGKYLIGVGRDGDENGENGNAKIALFDISDPKAPKEVDKVILKNSHSEAEYNHKAFVANPGMNLVGMPFTHYDENWNGGHGDFCTFLVKDGALTESFTLGSPSGGYAQRGTWIGDTWYVLSGKYGDGSKQTLTAYGMQDGKELGRLAF